MTVIEHPGPWRIRICPTSGGMYDCACPGVYPDGSCDRVVVEVVPSTTQGAVQERDEHRRVLQEALKGMRSEFRTARELSRWRSTCSAVTAPGGGKTMAITERYETLAAEMERAAKLHMEDADRPLTAFDATVWAEHLRLLGEQHRGAVEALQNLGDPAWARGAGGASMAEYARRELRALGIEPRGGAVKAVPGTEHYEATGDALCGNVMLHARGASSIFAQTYNLAGAEKIAAALNDHQGAVDLIRALGSGWRANDDEAISNALVALEDWAGLTEQGGR